MKGQLRDKGQKCGRTQHVWLHPWTSEKKSQPP